MELPSGPTFVSQADTHLVSRSSLMSTASVRLALWGLFVIALIAALKVGQGLMVPILTALLFGLALGRLQEGLERQGVKPLVAAGFLLFLIVLVILVAAWLMVLPFEEWLARLPEIYGALKHQLNNLRALLVTIENAADAVQETTGIDTTGEGAVMSAPAILGGLAISLPATGGQMVLFAGVLFFYLGGRSKFLGEIAERSGTSSVALVAFNTMTRAEAAVSDYFGTVMLINAGLGVAAGLGLYLTGLSDAWFWGALAAVLNFIPYIGPLVLTLLLLGAGLLMDVSPFEMLLPALVFLGLNVVEANFVTPSVLGRRMLIEPLFVVLSLGFWLWLWGAMGALLAVPALLVLQALMKEISADTAA